MKAKLIAVLVTVVLSFAGLYLLFAGGLMPRDDESQTAPYEERVAIYIPPAAEMMVETSARVSLDEYKTISTARGNKNFMFVTYAGGWMGSARVVRIDYHSFTAEGRSYFATETIQTPVGKGLRWGILSPVLGDQPNIVDGKIIFQIKYYPGFTLAWALALSTALVLIIWGSVLVGRLVGRRFKGGTGEEVEFIDR